MAFVIRCGKCGNWQGYSGTKPLRGIVFKCQRCNCSRSLYSKQTGNICLMFKEVNYADMPSVVAELNARGGEEGEGKKDIGSN